MSAEPDRPTVAREVLPEDVWLGRRNAHQSRVDVWTGPVLERAARGERHPVEDFLFTYYSYRPAQLRRWSPGAGVTLAGCAASELAGTGHWIWTEGGATLGPVPPRVVRAAEWVGELLERTAARTPQFGCFGLHEWAMLHCQQPDEVRHLEWPLRLGRSGTNHVVECLPVRCSHFDAFRFFTPRAQPLNALQPTRESQHELEQGGCLHANMDLYKWAYKLAPWVPAELVADCFDLARRVRVLDMRASPYDLSALGYVAVAIETPEGRREYAEAQRRFAREAARLRARLLAQCRRLV